MIHISVGWLRCKATLGSGLTHLVVCSVWVERIWVFSGVNSAFNQWVDRPCMALKNSILQAISGCPDETRSLSHNGPHKLVHLSSLFSLSSVTG